MRIEGNPKQLALAFAMSVTATSFSCDDIVARRGEESLFRALHRILPEVREQLAPTAENNEVIL
jgi:hypothetical protein